ncbi:MAG: hypothetical protein KDH09_11925 [Chrysiogenetes bacterium]|nr:hypothetical protein [Chrysiogenetes bacterium]
MASPFRIRPGEGLRALRRSMRDPDDTGQVGVVVRAFQGKSPQRIARRARRTREGRRLLREKPDLLAALRNREWLASLPEKSLGRAYLDFVVRYKISADGLMDALAEPGARSDYERHLSEDELFLNQWAGLTHDLFHVVTGYETDLIGEVAVLNFTLAQSRNPGLGVLLIPPNVLTPIFAPRHAAIIWKAALRGLRARWFLVQNWVELLEEPLEEVRRKLGVGPPPGYDQFFSPKFRRGFESAAS